MQWSIAAAAGHHNLGKLSFGDLRLELADLPVSDSDDRIARPSAVAFSSSSPSTPDWVLVSMLGEEPQRISSHQARPHATSARSARSPTRRAAGASVRIAGPGARPPSLRASPIHVLRRPSGGTYLRCGRVSRASCSTVVLISLTAGG